jgi:hypothetical protein
MTNSTILKQEYNCIIKLYQKLDNWYANLTMLSPLMNKY